MTPSRGVRPLVSPSPPVPLPPSTGVRGWEPRGPVCDALPPEGDGQPDPVPAELGRKRGGGHRRADQPDPVRGGAGSEPGRRPRGGAACAWGLAGLGRAAAPLWASTAPPVKWGQLYLPLHVVVDLKLFHCLAHFFKTWELGDYGGYYHHWKTSYLMR